MFYLAKKYQYFFHITQVTVWAGGRPRWKVVTLSSDFFNASLESEEMGFWLLFGSWQEISLNQKGR